MYAVASKSLVQVATEPVPRSRADAGRPRRGRARRSALRIAARARLANTLAARHAFTQFTRLSPAALSRVLPTSTAKCSSVRVQERFIFHTLAARQPSSAPQSSPACVQRNDKCHEGQMRSQDVCQPPILWLPNVQTSPGILPHIAST
jgi:hypothetical protein